MQGNPSSLTSPPESRITPVLFATVDRLTNPPVSVAPELSSIRSCHQFDSFFTDKLRKLDKQSVLPYQVQDTPVHLNPLQMSRHILPKLP